MAVVLFTLPLLGEITLGTALGVVGTIASFLFNKTPSKPLPKAMSSAWGETWPLVYNTFRVPGKCLQAGNLVENDHKGLFGSKGVSFELTFAMGICEGPRQVGRIWADGQVIYDPRPIVVIPVWQPNHIYGVGDQIYADPSQPRWIFTASVNGESGSSPPSWNYESDQATRDNDIVWVATKYAPRNKIGKQYNFFFQIYEGTETQLPDSGLEEMVGTGNQLAYRGLCYCVFYQFDLGRYGNRIPNFEFEILGESNIEFISDAQYYGNGLNGGPFLHDDAGNIYVAGGAGGGGQNKFTNIKTGTDTLLSWARNTADAATLGVTQPGPWSFIPLTGKYFLAQAIYSLGPYALTFLLYEINTDGTATALGAQTYEAGGVGPFLCNGIRSDTGEIMFAWYDFSLSNLQLYMIDSIAGLQQPWALKNQPTRSRTVLELAHHDYSATPGPYLDSYGYGWVGNDLYIALNRAYCDWLNNPANVGQPGYSADLAFYTAASPGGVMLKISTGSDGGGAGLLTYIFEGPANPDFGWPFADEGLNKVGAPGHTSGAGAWDVYSGPVETQDPLTGAIQEISFTRAYSDQADEVGLVSFQGANPGPYTPSGSITGAPFTPTALGLFPSEPKVEFQVDGYYLWFGGHKAKLGNFAPTDMTLADICADVSGRIGLASSQYDYSRLSSVVPLGCAFLQRDTARSFIESLMPAFFFDLTDIGAKVVGSLRSGDSVFLTIPESDLAAVQGEAAIGQGTVVDKISSVKQNDIEIPQDMSINYYDSQHDYQQGSQQFRRGQVTQFSSGKNTTSVPVVMTPWDANAAAGRALYLLWVERTQRKVIVPPEYLALTPVDVIEVVRNNKNYVVRCTMVTLKTNWTIEVQSVSEDLGTYHITGNVPVSSFANFNPGTINPATTPVLAVVDTATLQPADLTLPGTYLAAANSGVASRYDTVSAQDSPDDSIFTTEATLPNEATMGTVAVALGNWQHYGIFDTVNSLTVSLLAGTLANADKWALSTTLTNNLAWLSNGEIIQFATATLLGGTGEAGDPYIYKLTGLRRGRLGTEQFIGTHGANETFVLLNSSYMGNTTYSASEIGAVRYWQALNDAPINPASAVQTLTMATRRLLPYAPSFIRSSRDMSGNLTITGKRRARWHGQALWTPAETDTPVTVQIDILNGSTVVRTLTTTLSANGSGVTNASGFTAYYAVADQVIDFGSPQASVSIKAYSLNATIGRGYGEARAA